MLTGLFWNDARRVLPWGKCNVRGYCHEGPLPCTVSEVILWFFPADKGRAQARDGAAGGRGKVPRPCSMDSIAWVAFGGFSRDAIGEVSQLLQLRRGPEMIITTLRLPSSRLGRIPIVYFRCVLWGGSSTDIDFYFPITLRYIYSI